jgi:hypothetical protein
MSEGSDDMSEEVAAAAVVARGLTAALDASRGHLELTDGPADWRLLLEDRRPR